jgi:hypothetical protein
MTGVTGMPMRMSLIRQLTMFVINWMCGSQAGFTMATQYGTGIPGAKSK